MFLLGAPSAHLLQSAMRAVSITYLYPKHFVRESEVQHFSWQAAPTFDCLVKLWGATLINA